MAQECGFFNAQLVGENEYDRVYLAEQFAAYFASFIGNGIYGSSMQKLEVLAQLTPDMSVKVLSGEAWINGWWYRNKDTHVLSLDIADGVLSRIDIIVVRWGNQERDMWLQVIKGEPSLNPVQPAIRRDADYYDLQLATVSVQKGTIKITQSAIKDTRLDNAVCGLVTGVVDQIDTTNLYNQFETYFLEFKQKYEADYDKWTKEQKQAYLDYIASTKADYDAWVAQKEDDYTQFVDTSQQEYSDYIAGKKSEYDQFVDQTTSDYEQWTTEQREKYTEWYETHTTAWQAEFEVWFQGIKDVLSGDIAGNLQLEIIELQERVDEIEEFRHALTEKQEVYPEVIGQVVNVIGYLTNSDRTQITTDSGAELRVAALEIEPVQDSTEEQVQGTIRFVVA